ncbi:hypothetical protein CMALT394_540007 [Carnobacterium maltaromaticum]|nr:hypothetical protein CMALT394_540007 [Carnobacterium maltaromaticum]
MEYIAYRVSTDNLVCLNFYQNSYFLQSTDVSKLILATSQLELTPFNGT